MNAFIGLGSNLADPASQIKAAVSALKALPQSTFLCCSSLYVSPPMGPQDQPDYVNAVVSVDTTLSPHALLEHLQAIEKAHGRERKRHWGARTLDLDILVYDQLTVNDGMLNIPHPGIALRSFVLYPLAEIAPELTIPAQGHITQLLKKCPRDGLQRIESDE